MRMMDDINMAKSSNTPVLDLVLGGTDDIYYRELFEESNILLQKSGNDFNYFTNMIILNGVSSEAH